MRALGLLLLLAAVAPAAEPVEDWKSILDAPKEKPGWEPAAGLNVVTPPHFFDSVVTFADQGGPFAAVGRNGGRVANISEYRVVIDLRTGKTVGTLKDAFEGVGGTGPTALGTDGKRFAVAVGGKFDQPAKVTIYDTATGKAEGELSAGGEIDVLQFAGDRLLVSTKTASDVYDVSTRKSVFNADHQRSQWGAARSTLTPTGKFLIETTGTGLRMYDVAAGRSLFKLESPRQEKDKNTNADGVAVSPDGTRLAVLTESWNARRLVVYDAATGKVLADNPTPAVKGGLQAQRLAWSADGKGVLFNGESILDPDTGRAVYEFPGGSAPVKLAVTLGRGVVWDTADRNERRLTAVGLDADRTAKAKAAVAAGGTAADVLLPPLTKATLDPAKAAPPQLVGVPWAATPDPAPPTAAGDKPVPLDFAANTVRAFFVTGGPKPVALFETLFGGNPSAPDPAKPRLVKRVDLTAGRITAKRELPPGVQAEDVTADGSAVLTVEVPAGRRVDLFPLDDGNPYGFRPYESLPDGGQKVAVARFLTADRLLTVGEKGLVVVWSLPDFKQLATADLPGTKAWTLSPNKRYLAGIHNGAVRVLDLATGRVAGDLLPSFAPQPTPFPSFVSLRGDGREILAGFQSGSGPVLVRWDAATGKRRHEDPFAGTLATPLKPGYVGDNFLLLDFGQLYDLDRGAVVWTVAGGVLSASRPDDRVWYAAVQSGTACTLAAATFPTPEIEQTIADVSDGPGAVLRPGTRVSLSLDVKGEMARTFRLKIGEAVKSAWRNRGLELVAKGAEVEVTLGVAERDTGERLNFRQTFGGNPFNRESVPVLELTARVEVAAGGEKLWASPPATYRTGTAGFVRLPAGETDVGDYLHKQTWAGVVGWAQGGGLPRFLAKTPGGVKALPQASRLTAAGMDTPALPRPAPRRR